MDQNRLLRLLHIARFELQSFDTIFPLLAAE